VGAPGDDSESLGVNGDPANDGGVNSGAVFVFERGRDGWRQEAYIKASTPDIAFGMHVALDGGTLAVAASGRSDLQDVIPGGIYIFVRDRRGLWVEEAHLDATVVEMFLGWGSSLVLSGNLLALGTADESSSGTGINPDSMNASAPFSGAVYLFVRDTSTWTLQAHIKASNTGADDSFGLSMDLDDNTLVVGAPNEDSNARGVYGDQTNNGAEDSGALYVRKIAP